MCVCVCVCVCAHAARDPKRTRSSQEPTPRAPFVLVIRSCSLVFAVLHLYFACSLSHTPYAYIIMLLCTCALSLCRLCDNGSDPIDEGGSLVSLRDSGRDPIDEGGSPAFFMFRLFCTPSEKYILQYFIDRISLRLPDAWIYRWDYLSP